MLLHGFNGFLVFLICWQLLRRAADPRFVAQALPIAGVATVFWLVHPYWVSTVLYVVQRMAMLSTFFCLAGLALYLKGRDLTQIAATRGLGWWRWALQRSGVQGLASWRRRTRPCCRC